MTPAEAAALTGAPKLVTLERAITLRRKAKAARDVQQRAVQRAEKRAWDTVVKNLELLDSLQAKHGWNKDILVDTSLARSIHPSHSLRAAGSTQAVYCIRCAAWCAGTKLKS